MAKEAIISTSRLNCYGTRVLTEGIDTEQYKKNPVLLFMHRRGRKEDMPIGVIENLRVEGDTLYGTPKFDEDTEDERNIARKWERGSLRMLSAGLDIVEWSEDPSVLVAGQTRPTITKSKLTEVSVVDIGANDDALQVGLYHEGALLKLAAGEENAHLPLLKQNEPETEPEQKPQENKMEKVLLKLGLAPGATEDEAVAAIGKLQEEKSAATLARITDAVDTAIKEKRIDAGKKEKYVELGKKVGLDGLKDLLGDIAPAQKPLDLVKPSGAGSSAHTELKWETASADELAELRENDREEYARLFKEHYGSAPTF